MRLLTCSLGLLLAATSCPALSEPSKPLPPPAGGTSSVSKATAATLARTVAPIDILLPLELEQARKAILALPTLDEDAKQLEQEYPGLYAALWTAVEPQMKHSTEAAYPSYWAALERLYAGSLTETEAHAVLTFFQSATGQKLIRNMYGSFDGGPMFADMAKSGDYTIGEKQMKTVIDAAKSKAVQQIGPEDEADLWILMASIDLKKFQTLGAETQKVTLAWLNEEEPEDEAKIGKIMEEAMQQYMDAHPPKP
jgi:hypothetical protein